MNNVSEEFVKEFDKETEKLKGMEGAILYTKLTEDGAHASGSHGNGVYLIGALTAWIENFAERSTMPFDSVLGQIRLAHQIGLELYCRGELGE